ncbi:MAG TPA: Coq4 family protein [Phenylobacterium sp.]|uniref:Coq4 family protein n=1 Tax=Phenylobacterium sp. TaxID=1871053 RepID=UPI002B46875C|nr:Coq4 family protein [Phenylobacterium sp.]HKR88746.1 Coq4 family protein [Phenylobacterium sp.]
MAAAQGAEAAPARGVATRLEWGRALAALRKLLADGEDTAQVFEIMRALNGKANVRNYQRLLTTREGGRIAYEHVELADLLMDDAWLDALPDGSVGAAYREFMRAERLSAEGLAAVSRQRLAQIEQAHPYAWFGRRTRDIHDVWHVLTGYGRDRLGEACLVAFSYAQTRGPGWALIALGAVLRTRNLPVARAIWQGFRRGRAAAWLPGEDYERLLNEPLDAARRRLRITSLP